MNAPLLIRAGRTLQLDRYTLAKTAGIVLLSAVVAFAVRSERGEVAGALAFILGTVLAGAVAGLGAGLIAATATFLLYNFYFAEPVLTLRLTTGSDIAPLLAFNLCALVSGVLAGRLKDRARAADRAKGRLVALLRASQALQSALTLAEIASLLADGQLEPDLHGRLAILKEGGLVSANGGMLAPAEVEVAAKAVERAEPVVCEGELAAFCLSGSEGPLGVLVLGQTVASLFEPTFLSALVNLLALAMERAVLSQSVAQAEAKVMTEQFKSVLLSSVSHDFRTPLATITASASSLIAYGDRLDGATSAGLLRRIVEESEALDRYAGNLLEMTRVEAGQSPEPLQTLSASEVVTAAIRRVRPRAGGRTIERSRLETDLLVRADAALFELVLVNVLENAILYSEDGARIQVGIAHEAGACRIVVADEGFGIPAEDLRRVFERFYRVSRGGRAPRGSGLGLAIAKGFVEALGGHIEAQIPGIGERGSRIVISLPLVAETALT